EDGRKMGAHEAEAIPDGHPADAERVVEKIPRDHQPGNDELEWNRNDRSGGKKQADEKKKAQNRQTNEEPGEGHLKRARHRPHEALIRPYGTAEAPLLDSRDALEGEAGKRLSECHRDHRSQEDREHPEDQLEEERGRT